MSDPHDTRVLLTGIAQPLAGELVSAFAEQGYSAMLVTDPTVAERRMQELSFDLLLISRTALEAQSAAFVWPPRRSSGALLVLGDERIVDVDDRVHASIPADVSARDAVFAASVLMQHQARQPRHAGPELRCGRIALDVRHRTATLDEQPLALTRLEFRIVQALAEANDEVVSRRELEQFVWGHDPVDGGARIAAHIRRLRTKLDAAGASDILITVRGEGFRLASDSPFWDPFGDSPPVGDLVTT